MKRFLDKILPWRIRIHNLEMEVMRLNVAVTVRDEQLALKRAEARKLAEIQERNRKGMSVMAEFIYRTHRLNVPFAEGSIRDAIQKGMNARQ